MSIIVIIFTIVTILTLIFNIMIQTELLRSHGWVVFGKVLNCIISVGLMFTAVSMASATPDY